MFNSSLKKSKIVVFTVALFVCENSFAQCPDYPFITLLSFDDSTCLEYLTIDTVGNPNNIWQIGPPQKLILSSPHSPNKVIITDTINTYPINDTSSFVLWHEMAMETFPGATYFYLTGWYYSDTDSLNDYGKIEFSADNGNSWLLVSEDTAGIVPSSAITLTGSSAGWQEFFIDLEEVRVYYGLEIYDTVLIKFTFFSDANPELRDGLMFDDLTLQDFFAGAVEDNSHLGYLLYPNPTKDKLYVYGAPKSYAIYSLNGSKVQQGDFYSDSTISVADIEKGLYVIEIHFSDNDFQQSLFVRH